MGALTVPVFVGATQVVSGDVLRVRRRGFRALFRRPFLALVDARDRSMPYLVVRRGRRVLRVPLEGAPALRGAEVQVYRLPGVDRALGSRVAARAAERKGEGIHHPDYDCGRTIASDAELVADAYRAAGVDVTVASGVPGVPLVLVRGPQDPPNQAILPDAIPRPEAGASWLARGIEPRPRSGPG